MVAILIHSQVYTYFLKHSKSGKSQKIILIARQVVSSYVSDIIGLICDRFLFYYIKDLTYSSGRKQTKIYASLGEPDHPDPIYTLVLFFSLCLPLFCILINNKIESPNRAKFKSMDGSCCESSQVLLLVLSYLSSQVTYPNCTL